MYKVIDTDNWIRNETFQHFKNFEFPFFSITTHVEITDLYHKCKTLKISINHALHYCCLLAIDLTAEFKFRFKNNQIICYDRIHGGATIMLDDTTFRYCLYEFDKTFAEFQRKVHLSETMVRKTLSSDPRTEELNVVHFSVIPWIQFHAVSHARRYDHKDSIPKITIGKFIKEKENVLMPLSIELNHCFADAYHVSLFIENLIRVLKSF